MMETFVGGGAALFTLGVGKLGLRPVFQGEVGDDCYGELIRSKFRESHVDDSLLAVSKELKTGISLSFTNEKDRSFLTYRGTNEKISISNVDLEKVKEAAHIHVTGYMGSINHNEYLELLKKSGQRPRPAYPLMSAGTPPESGNRRSGISSPTLTSCL